MLTSYLLPNTTLTFSGREGTTDEGVIRDCLINNNYGIKAEYLPEKSIVVDIGANIGVFTCYAASLQAGSRLISYEPEPENMALLTQNIKLCKCDKQVTVHQYAVGKPTESAKMIARHGNSRLVDSAGGAPGSEGRIIEVPVISLASVLDDNHIVDCHFLKVDAEWSEYAIFDCPSDIIGRFARIAMEFHPTTADIFGKLICKLNLTHRLDILGSHLRGGYIFANL